MGIAISKLRGLDAALASKLKDEGIGNSDKLLEVAATPKGRKELAAKCDVETRVILELANRADLARLKGVAGVFGDLLEASGVDTVKELAGRRADNLHAKIVETNAEKKLAGRNPTAADVEGWVTTAKTLPKLLEY